MSNKLHAERRVLTLSSPLEVRKANKSENSAGNISGYGLKWNARSLPLPFTEIVRKGSVNLNDGENRFLYFGHDANRILASTRGGSLTLRTDDTGLAFSADIADTEDGRTPMTLAERGDLDSMSFGFIVNEGGDRWTATPSGAVIRELISICVLELSCVGSPAYPTSGFGIDSRAMQKYNALKRGQSTRDNEYDLDADDADDTLSDALCGDCERCLRSCTRCSGLLDPSVDERSRKLHALLLKRLAN